MKVYWVGDGLEPKAVGIGDMYLAGGEERSYLVVKDGEKSIKFKKGNFNKD